MSLQEHRRIMLWQESRWQPPLLARTFLGVGSRLIYKRSLTFQGMEDLPLGRGLLVTLTTSIMLGLTSTILTSE
jgi:hypothetical protein